LRAITDENKAVSPGRSVHLPTMRSVAVDLHCHILPGLDDGARDLDDALAMTRQAERDGVAAAARASSQAVRCP